MVPRTMPAKQFEHRCLEMREVSKAWTGFQQHRRGFILTWKQRTRFGVMSCTETASLRRAQNFCKKHGITLPSLSVEHV